jgi:hypothetical protein
MLPCKSPLSWTNLSQPAKKNILPEEGILSSTHQPCLPFGVGQCDQQGQGVSRAKTRVLMKQKFFPPAGSAEVGNEVDARQRVIVL